MESPHGGHEVQAFLGKGPAPMGEIALGPEQQQGGKGLDKKILPAKQLEGCVKEPQGA